VSNANGGNFALFVNNGSGIFSAPSYFNTGSNPMGLLASDFNGDGNLDIAVTNSGSNDISVRLGNGLASFGPVANYSVGNSPQSLAAADFDGDNNPDLAVANSGAGFTTNQVTILMGSGSGTFLATSNFTSTPILTLMLLSPSSIKSADLNNDGNADIAISYAGSDCVSVRFGTGSGTFGKSVEYGTNGSPSDIIIRDLNFDGYLDLIASNLDSDNVSIMMGSQGGIFLSSITNESFPGMVQCTDIMHCLLFTLETGPATWSGTMQISCQAAAKLTQFWRKISTMTLMLTLPYA
jgi:hypothetical protein